MKGQLSAEMLILIVVILAIVAIAAMQLMGTAKETSGNIKNQTERINRLTSEALKGQEGESCLLDEDCVSNHCEGYRCT